MSSSQSDTGRLNQCPIPAADNDVGEGVCLTPLQLAMVAGEMAPHRWQRDLVLIRCDLQEAIDEDRLRTALARLVERHESLRTALVWPTPGQPGRHVVRDKAEVPLTVVDLQGLAPSDQDQRQDEIVNRLWQQPLEVAEPSRCWATLLRLAPERHGFILTYQETVLDEESGKILIRELFDFYDAEDPGQTPSITNPITPGVSFRDYLEWFNGRGQADNCRFWREYLEQAPAPTPPPLRGAGICDQAISSCCGELTRRLSAETTQRLRRWADDANATLNSVLLAAWAIVNVKHASADRSRDESGESVDTDVRFSAVFSERTSAYPHADSAVAMCFSVLPFVVRAPNRCSSGQLLRAVRDHEAELRAHSVLPDGDQAARRQYGHPSTQSLVFYDETPIEDGLAESRPDWSHRRFAMFGRNPYAIAMRGFGGERLRVQAWYNPGLYGRSAVDCLLDQLVHVLEQLASGGDETSIAEINVQPTEHQQQIEEWSVGPVAASESITIHEWFERRARRSPEAVAVIGRSETLTYGQLEGRSNQIAQLLVEAGLQFGDAVAIHAGRSPETVAAALGVMKAGGHYVPLDAHWPTQRAALALDRVDGRYLITDDTCRCSSQSIATRLEHDCTVICLNGATKPVDGETITWLGPNRIAEQSTDPLRLTVDPDDTAYIIFTSGSTGTPKGVRVSHRPVSNLIDWALDTYRFNEHDRGLWVTSLGFDLSVFDLFGLLAAGGSIRIADEDELQRPERLVDCLLDEPITFWNSAPQTLDRLRPYLDRLAPIRSEPPRLRLVFLSGDWVPLDLSDFLQQHFSVAEVIALGGATEAAVWSNHYPVGDVQPTWRSIPYGRPIRNARYHVLDAERRPCGIGVSGELYIGGDVLAQGYVADVEQTADHFLPDPFITDSDARLYRTGDAARWWPDGNMELLGRLDHQVKLRGFRVELGEIEAVLRRHPEVRDAVVTLHATEPGPTTTDPIDSHSLDQPDHLSTRGAVRGLRAYVVPRDEAVENLEVPRPSIDLAELKNYLTQHLPVYMVPNTFIPIEGLPLNDNGKVNRGALPRPTWSHTVREQTYVAPQTEPQRRLAEVFSHVLQQDRIGLNDNFFTIGGDSLSALGVIFGAEDAGFRIDIDQLQKQSLAELAISTSLNRSKSEAQAETSCGDSAVCRRESVETTPSDSPIPLVPSQRWLIDRNFKYPSAYAFNVWLRADEKLDHDAVRQAWRAVVGHHEGLRLIFDTTSQGWTPRVQPPETLTADVVEVDLRDVPRDDLRQRLDMVVQDVSRSIDISSGPLPCLTLVRTSTQAKAAAHGESGDLLLLFIPHIISDEHSARVVIADLDTAYRAAEAGREIVLPPASLPFTDWARHLHTAAARPELTREAEAFQDQPWDRAVRLPLDIPRPSKTASGPSVHQHGGANTYATTADHRSKLSTEISRQLLDRSRELALPVEAFLVEALTRNLAEWTGSNAVLLAMTGNGREQVFDLPPVHRSVGYFSVIYPALIQFDSDVTGLDAVRLVHHQLGTAPGRGIRHGLLGHLHPEITIRNILADLPQPQIKFNYHGLSPLCKPSCVFQPASVPIPGLLDRADRRAYLLNIEVGYDQGRFKILWRFSTSTHRHETIEHLDERYRALITESLERSIPASGTIG